MIDLFEDTVPHKDKNTKKPNEIAKEITFDNAHLVAHALVQSDPIVALALKRELDYWDERISG